MWRLLDRKLQERVKEKGRAMRKEYELTEEQYKVLAGVCEKGRDMVLAGTFTVGQQAKVNQAWKDLGDERGFKYLTVVPTRGTGIEDLRFFKAEPIEL